MTEQVQNVVAEPFNDDKSIRLTLNKNSLALVFNIDKDRTEAHIVYPEVDLAVQNVFEHVHAAAVAMNWQFSNHTKELVQQGIKVMDAWNIARQHLENQQQPITPQKETVNG